jgi:hypothetical protein
MPTEESRDLEEIRPARTAASSQRSWRTSQCLQTPPPPALNLSFTLPQFNKYPLTDLPRPVVLITAHTCV